MLRMMQGSMNFGCRCIFWLKQTLQWHHCSCSCGPCIFCHCHTSSVWNPLRQSSAVVGPRPKATIAWQEIAF